MVKVMTLFSSETNKRYPHYNCDLVEVTAPKNSYEKVPDEAMSNLKPGKKTQHLQLV